MSKRSEGDRGQTEPASPEAGDDLVPHVRNHPYTDASNGGMVLISNDTADFADTTLSRERLPAHEGLARPADRCGQLTPGLRCARSGALKHPRKHQESRLFAAIRAIMPS